MRIVVIEADREERERLGAMVAALDGVASVVVAGEARVALRLARQGAVELVVAGLSGDDACLAWIGDLQAMPRPPAVVACGADDRQALAAFEAGLVDYLLKPVLPARLALALQRAHRHLQAARAAPAWPGPGPLYVRRGGGWRAIGWPKVQYLRAEHKYVVLRHADGEDLLEEPLRALERRFPGRLLRIHRNCLVARHALVELRRGADGRFRALLGEVATPLPVSRRCLPGLRRDLAGSWPGSGSAIMAP